MSYVELNDVVGGTDAIKSIKDRLDALEKSVKQLKGMMFKKIKK